MNGFPNAIVIRDVGPRDGLQAEQPVSVEDRVRMIEGLAASGLTRVEVCSFVSPKAVPSMAGGAEVVAAVPSRLGFRRTALVPNLRGAQMALDSGVEEITITVSASESYSQKNVHMSVAEAIESAATICALTSSGTPVDVVISCAFGSPYEGELSPDNISALCDQLLEIGATCCTLADTTGMATPKQVESLLRALSERVRTDVGLHLHETRGTALLNAYVAMQLGVARFDCSVGGLGGSPFAAGAAGNLATEDLVYLCDEMGIATGIDLEALREVSRVTSELIGRAVPSRVASAGPRLQLAGSVPGSTSLPSGGF